MTPGSFDIDTAKGVVADERARAIEGKARQDADAGKYEPPAYGKPTTYWGGVQEEMPRVIYRAAFNKRTARIQRMAQQAATTV